MIAVKIVVEIRNIEKDMLTATMELEIPETKIAYNGPNKLLAKTKIPLNKKSSFRLLFITNKV
jgi:hypothetical protein